MRFLRWLYHRWRWSGIESWRVFYNDGTHTYPLRREQAKTLARMFGGKVKWARGADGNLLP